MKRYLKGVGMTSFGEAHKTSEEMCIEAVQHAFIDSELTPREIDAVVVSNVSSKMNSEKQRLYPPIIASILQRKIPMIRVPAVCGGGGAALWTALRLHFNNVLVVAVDRVLDSPTPLITHEIMTAGENKWEQEEGLIFPAQNALVAQAHMAAYGTTAEDLHAVSFKNHHFGSLNPKARFYGKKITMEQIRNAPVVATPFNLFDCSISVNGAAAAIVSSDKTDIEIIGSALASDYLPPFERDDMTRWEGTVKAGKEAFAEAGITPEDVDVAELHDAFTIVELIAYEDLGFCKKGYSKEMIRNHETDLDGRTPVNTSGGLKARGHPISPTGVAQVVEIADQLRGRSGQRQVSNPHIGLSHNIGGAGGTTTVHLFRKVAG